MFSVRAGRVQEVNAAARAAFARVRVGTEVSELFEERSREKLARALHKSASGATPELQFWGASGGEPKAVRFLILSTEGEQLFIAQSPGYSESIAERLMSANSELANLTRELSPDAISTSRRRRFSGRPNFGSCSLRLWHTI